ncbi:MAG: ATP-binding cassette domain-containing protein [Magnetococcales bacterium]|nr:ATP-binding cassette domain-containing protein [Magnetococcales bacterium]
MAYGKRVIQRDLDFSVTQGEIFIIMGGSGCGKSTLLRHLIGLQQPTTGTISLFGHDLWAMEEEERTQLMRRFGVLYQNGALWSSMTLAENIALPLERFTTLATPRIQERVNYLLALVGLEGFGDHGPAEISGGMRKRAGLARALALDPEILFFDEPSAGLDPVSARRLDDLILELRQSLGATIVVVTHELASLMAIGSDGIMLDADAKTAIAHGAPARLLQESRDPRVRLFLSRGEGDSISEESAHAHR